MLGKRIRRIIDALSGEQSRRKDEMREYAFQKNMDFQEVHDLGLIDQMSGFKLFRYGNQRTIRNMISMKNLQENVYLFDYEYTISSGNSHRRFRQTVKLYDSKLLGLPEFKLSPEGFFSILAEWFGRRDIDFSEDIQFSDSFLLSGEFEPVIRQYFTNDVRQLCLQNHQFYMDGVNYYLSIHIRDEILRGADLKAFDRLTYMVYEVLKLQSAKAGPEESLIL